MQKLYDKPGICTDKMVKYVFTHIHRKGAKIKHAIYVCSLVKANLKKKLKNNNKISSEHKKIVHYINCYKFSEYN